MLPVIVLGGAALGILYLMSKKPLTQAEQQLAIVGKKVTGRSGKQWRTMLAEHPVGNVYKMNVLAEAGQFGPHTLMPTIQYRQTGDDKSTRVLVLRHPDIPDVAFTTALSDFGVRSG